MAGGAFLRLWVRRRMDEIGSRTPVRNLLLYICPSFLAASQRHGIFQSSHCSLGTVALLVSIDSLISLCLWQQSTGLPLHSLPCRVAACRQGTDFSLKKPLLVFSASKMSTLKFLVTIPGRWTICFSFVKLMHTQIQQGGCSYFGLSKNDLVSQ